MRRGEQMENGKGTDLNRGAGVEVTRGVVRKARQAPVLKPKRIEKAGTVRHGTMRHVVQCTNDYLNNGDGMEVHGVRVGVVPEVRREAEAVSKTQVQEVGNV